MSFTFGSGITIETGITIESGPLPPQPPTLTSITPSSGRAAGGLTTSLVGTNFTGTTSVEFGSTPATSYSVTGATTMTAVTPPGTAGSSVRVKITNPAGTTPVNTAFSYYPLAPNTAPAVGTTVAAFNEQWANFGSAQSGITTSTQPAIPAVMSGSTIIGYPIAWQLCYSWTSVILNVLTNYNGFNTWAPWSTGGAAQSWGFDNTPGLTTPPNTFNLPEIPTTTQQSFRASGSGGNYAAGAFVSMNLSSSVGYPNVSRYFLMGVGAPFVTFETMAQNKTFTKNGANWFTACNTVYYPEVGTPVGTVSPAQVGGNCYTYRTLENTTIVQSFKPFN